MFEQERVLESRSYHITPHKSSRTPQSELVSKSDVNFLPTPNSPQGPHEPELRFFGISIKEYYKKYEHDELPVKDSDINYTISKGKGSLTNSDLDNLEKRIYTNVSQELQTDESSFSSLDSNIKFFKTTVEKIFDNFFTSMSDFEHYKKRFNDVIAKSNEGSVDGMEEFIKDMFEHIMSAENSVSRVTRTQVHSCKVENKDIPIICSDTNTVDPEVKGFMEAYKNDNYQTDSILDDNWSKLKKTSKLEEMFNIIVLGGTPCVEIKLTGRNLLSEVQIKEPCENTINTETTASAGDLKRLAAKKLELEKYIGQQQDYNAPDRDIPVKISFAKKNIHLNEDFSHDINKNGKGSKSFITKICNILCKKFRRSNIG